MRQNWGFYTTAGISHRRVSVCLSVCLSGCYTPVVSKQLNVASRKQRRVIA